MLSKGQKAILYVTGILSFFVGIFVFIPFRTFGGVNIESNILKTELIIKLIVLFLVTLLLSIYPNIKKYQEIKNGRERSKVFSMASYLPLTCYLVGLLLFICHTLGYPYVVGTQSPLGDFVTSVILVIIVCYLCFMLFEFHRAHNLVSKLNKSGALIVDIALLVLTVCFGIMAWRVDLSYYRIFEYTEGFFATGDVFLFIIYAIILFVFVVFLYGWVHTVRVNEQSIYVNPADFTTGKEEMEQTEYNRAYNDILDDFESYFDAGYQLEEQPKVEEKNESSVQTAPVEETVAPIEEESKVVYKKTEPVKEVSPLDETLFTDEKVLPLEKQVLQLNVQKVVATEDDQKELRERKAAIEQKQTELAKQEQELLLKQVELENVKKEKVASLKELEKQNLDELEKYKEQLEKEVLELKKGLDQGTNEEKKHLDEEAAKLSLQKQIEEEKQASLDKTPATVKVKKEIRPTYPQIVMYAKSLEGEEIVCKGNDKETQHKYFINKKLYLVTQETNSDYRIFFQASEQQILNYLLNYPGVITVAKSPKGGSWLKLTNKGTLTEAFLKQVIKESVAAFKEQVKIEEEKKKQARDEKARLKKLEKEAAKKQKAKESLQ